MGTPTQRDYPLHDQDPDDEHRAGVTLASLVLADDTCDDKVGELTEVMQMLGLKQ